jgi:hypothetical protein
MHSRNATGQAAAAEHLKKTAEKNPAGQTHKPESRKSIFGRGLGLISLDIGAPRVC